MEYVTVGYVIEGEASGNFFIYEIRKRKGWFKPKYRVRVGARGDKTVFHGAGEAEEAMNKIITAKDPTRVEYSHAFLPDGRNRYAVY